MNPEKHSEKGLATLTLMGTVPSDWGHCEIEWVKEIRVREVKVQCLHCKGRGLAYVHLASGKVVDNTSITDYPEILPLIEAHVKRFNENNSSVSNQYTVEGEIARTKSETGIYSPYISEAVAKGFVKYQKCPHCLPYNHANRKFYYEAQGFTLEDKEVEVMVGYPQWAQGTKFDSRFVMHDCNLCGKTIYARNLRPVTGKGADGRIHGMWVGEDCAMKFLGLKNYKLKGNQAFFREFGSENHPLEKFSE